MIDMFILMIVAAISYFAAVYPYMVPVSDEERLALGAKFPIQVSWLTKLLSIPRNIANSFIEFSRNF
jgi:hypothetical protein